MKRHTRLLGWGAIACLSLAAWRTTASAAAATLDIPDGTMGLVPVTVRVSLSSPYTVPNGRNFYITGVGDSPKTCETGWYLLTLLYCHLRATGVTNLLPAGNLDLYAAGTSNILGPGTVIDSTSSAVTFDLFGFTVPATVPVVLVDLPPSGGYEVPAGMNLYITKLGYANSTRSLSKRFQIGSLFVGLVAFNRPLVIGAGQTITNVGDAMGTINGYLKPQ